MKYKPDFLVTPYAIVEDPRCTNVDERVYSVIYYFRKMRGEKCTASNDTIGEIAKTTSRTVQNCLTKLEKLGYIVRVFEDKEKRIRKEIIPLVVMGFDSEVRSQLHTPQEEVSSTDDTGYHPQMTGVSSTDDQISKSNKEDNKEDIGTGSDAPSIEVKKYKYDAGDLWLAKHLDERVEENYPIGKEKTNLESWANTIRLMRERDNFTHESILVLIAWVHGTTKGTEKKIGMSLPEHEFWSVQIRSATNLRAKKSTLLAQMQRQNKLASGVITSSNKASQEVVGA